MTEISNTLWEVFMKGRTAGEGLAAAIAQDRLERPFREEEPAQEVPCANPFYEQQRAAVSADEYERVHNAERNRAYIAIDVLKLENPLNLNDTIQRAARDVILSFLGYEVEGEEDPDFADVAAAPEPPAEPYPWPDEKPRPYPDDQGY